MSKVVYAKAGKEDAQSIYELTSVLYPKGYPKLWYKEGVESLKGVMEKNEFFKATIDDKTVGCIALNNDYWKNIPVSYLESLMVHPSAQGKGIGKGLIEIIKKESQRSIISLDRVTSVQMMLNMGFKPSAFIPEKEYFGDKKESLFLVHYPKEGCSRLKIEKTEPSIRLKKKESQLYLLEITGNNIESDDISRIVKENNYSEYVITINQTLKSNKQDLSLEKCQKIILGNLSLNCSNIELSLFTDKNVDKNFPTDFEVFIKKCKNEDAKNMIKKTVNSLRRI